MHFIDQIQHHGNCSKRSIEIALQTVGALCAWALLVRNFELFLAGSVLLLMRSRFADHAFGVSLVGMAVSFSYQYGMSDAIAVMGSSLIWFSLVIVAIGVGLFVYARRQAASGVLR